MRSTTGSVTAKNVTAPAIGLPGSSNTPGSRLSASGNPAQTASVAPRIAQNRLRRNPSVCPPPVDPNADEPCRNEENGENGAHPEHEKNESHEEI